MEIRNFRKAETGAKYEAVFDVYIPALDLELAQYKLMRGNKGGLWIAPPCYCEQDIIGTKKWKQYAKFGPKKGDKFIQEVQGLLNAYLSLQDQFPGSKPTQDTLPF